MNYKLLLPLLVLFQAGCSTTTAKSNLKESAVRTLLDGTFIVRKTANTPVKANLMNAKYYQYYSGLHADSIGCKSYSQVKIKVNKNEQAYKCMVNGIYLTQNSLAIGTPWK